MKKFFYLILSLLIFYNCSNSNSSTNMIEDNLKYSFDNLEKDLKWTIELEKSRLSSDI